MIYTAKIPLAKCFVCAASWGQEGDSREKHACLGVLGFQAWKFTQKGF